MEEKTVKFEYDAVNNIVFTDDNYQVNTEADVDDFFRQYTDYLVPLGRKVNMISKIDGLHISAAISPYYGKRAKETVIQYVLNFARYGENPTARMTVRTSSRKADLETNICDSREQALEYLLKLMGQPEKPKA